MTRTVFQVIFFWTVPPVYFRFCMTYTYLTFKSGKRTCLQFARILPTEHHLASQEGKNGYATYQGMYEHNLYSLRYYKNKTDKIWLERCSMLFFLNSATCIFSVLYAVYVLDLHWQQSFVYITNVYFKQWPGEFRVIIILYDWRHIC
jgi:hypothetical protein